MPTGELRPATLGEQVEFTMDVRKLPQVGRPPGDPQQRWTTYMMFEGWILDDIANGTNVMDATAIGIFVNGVHTDKEAMAWAEKNGKPRLLYARGIAETAISKGRRDITRIVNAYFGNTSSALDDPWSDAAFEIIIGGLVSTIGVAGVNVFRAGTHQGWAQLFVQAPLREQIRNAAAGAQASRMAARGSRQFLPKVTPAMTKNGITEGTLIRAAVNNTSVQWALRNQLRDAYIRTAWYSTVTATGGQIASIVDNALFAAENDMADLDALAIAEADREMEQALQDAEQPKGFLEESEAIWGDPGRGIQTRPDPSAQSGLQSLVRNGVTVTDSQGNPVRVQLTGNETPEEIAAALGEAGRTGLSEDDPLIGVPPGGFAAQTPSYIAEYDKLARSREGTQGGLIPGKVLRNEIVNPTTVFVQAEYLYSDVPHILFNMTPGQVEAFQIQAIDAGLVNPDVAGFAIGSRGSQTLEAMETVMSVANNLGRDWQGAVEVLVADWQTQLKRIEDEEEEANRRIYPPQPFMALDTAYTAQMVKEDIRTRLGREPNQAELQMLQNYIASEHRSMYEENERVLRADFAAQGRAIEEGTEQDAVSGVQIDWDARFAEEFEDRYAAELDRKKLTEETAAKRGNLMTSFRLGQNI